MTTMEQPGLSAAVAAQVRAELALQGKVPADLARALGVTPNWVSRRVGKKANVDLTMGQLDQVTSYLRVTPTTIISKAVERLHGHISD